MALNKVSEGEVDAAIRSNTLSVTGRPSWSIVAHKSWYRIVLPVTCPESLRTELRIVVGVNAIDPSKFSITLFWHRTVRVRGLDFNGSHSNSHVNTEEWERRTHKHSWRDACESEFAYTPTDITGRTVQEVFPEFCTECGIACQAVLPELPPASMFNDDV